MGKLGMCHRNRSRNIPVPALGNLFGPFAGAVIGELLGGKKSMEAFKAGIGAFVGFLLSVVVKMALCGYFVYCFISALI